MFGSSFSRYVYTAGIRIAGAFGTLAGVSVIFFVLTDWLPGDFATATASRDTLIETILRQQFELGLFRSAWDRYWEWAFNVLAGDFGTSWFTRIEITELLATRLWHSLWLAGWAAALAIPVGIALGVASAGLQGSRFDRVVNVGALTAISVPDFVVAYALMALLGVHFKIFPVFVAYEPSLPLSDRLLGAGLPVLSLAFVSMTPVLRITRATVINVLREPYVEMAQLKGLGRWRIVLAHALPNAAGPIANAVVLVLGNLIVGLVVIETVFSYPGLGELLITAVKSRDIPLIQACGLLSAALYIALNLSADLISTLTNPRLLYAPPRQLGISLARLQDRITSRSSRRWLAAAGAAGVAFMVWQFAFSDVILYRQPLNVPAVKPGPRTELTVQNLQSDHADGLIHNAYFSPLGDHGPARHMLEGTVRVPAFRLERRFADSYERTTAAEFPAFSFRLFEHEGQLVPVERNIFLPRDSKGMRVILSPGRVWSEATDGDWSRAALPFTLVHRRGSASFSGVATFAYNASSVSRLRVQLAQEQIPWSGKFDAWGQTDFSVVRKPLPDIDQLRKAFVRIAEQRLDVRPWVDLQAKFWRSLEIFDGEHGRDDITVSGLMVDDVVYVRRCRTRAGPYPFCRQMRNAVYSVSKSVGAAAALLRLAEKYGPSVLHERIVDYAPIPTNHDGWRDVRFIHALDMTTGIGNKVPVRTAGYVDVDNTAMAYSVWNARTVDDKLRQVGRFANYPWSPGEVFRYRTSDTDLLAVAMDRYLKTREGPDARLWDMMNDEVYGPLGIESFPVRHTEEPDRRERAPGLGGTMLGTFEDVLKVARLFQNHGAHQGRQILHRDLTERAVSTDMSRGTPTGWVYEDGTTSTYSMSFWLMPFTGRGGCRHRIPAMAGVGGNYVILMPNKVIGFRFADGHDDAPGTWVSKHIRETADRVKGIC
ncbi:MAG: ABC transporter permease subunit [Pseudomonadota bacterium]